MEDARLYYVVLDAADPGRIRLARTQAEANAGVVISLDPAQVSGSDQLVLRRRRAHAAGGVEREPAQEFRQRSILRPKTVRATTTTIEEANIVGRDVRWWSPEHRAAEGQIDIALAARSGLDGCAGNSPWQRRNGRM